MNAHNPHSTLPVHPPAVLPSSLLVSAAVLIPVPTAKHTDCSVRMSKDLAFNSQSFGKATQQVAHSQEPVSSLKRAADARFGVFLLHAVICQTPPATGPEQPPRWCSLMKLSVPHRGDVMAFFTASTVNIANQVRDSFKQGR